jgi:hypothetical protein
VYGTQPRGVSELKESEQIATSSASVEEFAEAMKELHIKVKQRLIDSNQEYKRRADLSTVGSQESCTGFKPYRVGKESGSHRGSAHWRIGVSRDKSLVVEIVISDIPRGSKPLIRRTCVQRSSGIRVRHFGVSEERGTVAPGIAIQRKARFQQSELLAPEGVIGEKCRPASGFGVLKVLCTLTMGIAILQHTISRQG